jgi:hypothetical protein
MNLQKNKWHLSLNIIRYLYVLLFVQKTWSTNQNMNVHSISARKPEGKGPIYGSECTLTSNNIWYTYRLCHGSASHTLTSHREDPGSIPGDLNWNSRWKKCHWSKQDISPSSFVSPLIIITPLVHTPLSPPHEVCDSPDQAPNYHTLGPKLGASPVTDTWLESEYM